MSDPVPPLPQDPQVNDPSPDASALAAIDPDVELAEQAYRDARAVTERLQVLWESAEARRKR